MHAPSRSAPPGSDILATSPVINRHRGSKISGTVSVYATSVTLRRGKAILYLTLPNISAGVAPSQTVTHIFSVTVG
jgi:hypothetical protein